MAKVVSTKFGDRRLVNLPPVDLSGLKTPAVRTIEPRETPPNAQVTSPTRRVTKKANIASIRPVHKDYSYPEFHRKPERRGDKYVLTGPPVVDRGIVFDHKNSPMEDVIMDQLAQKYNVPAFRGYPPQGMPEVPPRVYPEPRQDVIQTNPSQQVPVGQPVLSTVPVQQMPQPQKYPVQQSLQPQSFYPSNPNEKHIYYGPNGEVIPGPPTWHQGGGRSDLEDFVVDGTLQNGQLTTVRLVDGTGRLPRMPDYLIRDLREKYQRFEKTEVRIVSKGGQIDVHATPQIQGPRGQEMQGEQYIKSGFQPQPMVQYVPVYIDEDGKIIDEEELDNVKVYERGYGRQSSTAASYAPRTRHRDYRLPTQSTYGRPNTEDPMAPYRWRRHQTAATEPTHRGYTQGTAF